MRLLEFACLLVLGCAIQARAGIIVPDTFKPATSADKPPQGNDAKCGFACHTSVKTRDYVFTDYAHR